MAQISPLRRRMLEDMTVRNLSPAQSYLNAVLTLGQDTVPERRQGPLRHALSAPPEDFTHLLAARSAEAMAVSRP
jgi:hypothetical protein